MRYLLPLLLLVAACTSTIPNNGDWPAYANAGGTRYSLLTEIDRTNLSRLEVAWTYHTGENTFVKDSEQKSTFEVTPIVVDGTMYLSTGFDKVIALDAATGQAKWMFEPLVDRNADYSEVTSRGVAYWEKGKRIFIGTIDARLIALDAATGKLANDFGTRGTVDLKTGVGRVRPGDYQVTSPPAVIGDLVIVGSAIGDNGAAELERGSVRAYDARTGALRWTFDPIAREVHSGAANAWAPMTPDPESGMVFIPTSSPSPDYYGGLRLGNNELANSIVAIRADTGAVVWHFQVVHHDLWDYDIATQPVLVEVRGIKAVAVATKMGHLFFFNRATGEPLFPIEERPVAASDVAGEEASPTQPFPTMPPPLVPSQLKPDAVFGVDDADRAACKSIIASLRHDGMFTPPSIGGTLQVPGNVGGMHWGGMSYDPTRHIIVANTNRLAAMVRLIPRADYDADRARSKGERIFGEYNGMRGTPYAMYRTIVVSPKGVPCTPPPWGVLTAVDVDRGTVRWETAFGGVSLIPGLPANIGSPNLGGSATTNGIVFIAAAMDEVFRAFDVDTGKELWHASLPASAQASPMIYRAGGKEFVVIAAGGHGKLHTKRGDAVVAFALE
ncbi:MAG TPA: pyrroloquinoline quinone-dependent dehydrogenase [Thermoanaerobaculia bacterium]|jgi:quinoprotein glucose dehydrogenase|nr:pyrroloquinoline quinone-dependent dehydrogenase [Thermoanaerobaculia bacterium]